MPLSIKIYNGKGVGRKILSSLMHELSQHYSTSLISSQEIIEKEWETNTDLFIMPGGRDVPYHQALKGEGNHRIRRYVEEGGAYLGICAGAYYGCSGVDFDRGMQLEVIASRELAFFPGIAQGPAFGLGTFRYNSEIGGKAALISSGSGEKKLRCYYNGGCFFPKASKYPQVKVMARYLEIEKQPAALIQMPIGKGKAILYHSKKNKFINLITKI